tara:strand:- start:144 stop:1130 length:987 start_codon:yes stop_codon:yes gene_type:complete
VILTGENLDVLAGVEGESFDALVTDPPYALKFRGKGWDRVLPPAAVWESALRVLKPGAHGLVFGGTRTFHRLVCSLEDAGFEVRDMLCWLYGKGMPKAKGVLKPGWEPIVLVRKPLRGTLTTNAARYGTGGLRIDACRIGEQASNRDGQPVGRWPANVLLDEEAASMLDAQTGTLTSGHGTAKRKTGADAGEGTGVAYGAENRPMGTPMISYGDSGGASRFFYCGRATRAEKEAGCEHLKAKYSRNRGNNHPTVKPLRLMQWLVRLVAPPGALVLDPFVGSGTTALACYHEGVQVLGIDRDAASTEIANCRLAYAALRASPPRNDASS